MQVLLDSERIKQMIAQLAGRLLDDPTLAGLPPGDIALVGIRSRGELIAERLAAEIKTQRNLDFPVGALDITMYRDDLNTRGSPVIPQGTDMNFRLDGKVLILIDDVLETGRSVRSALDAIADYGRPRLIRLLVLVDRGGREYPIAADYVGMKTHANPDRKITVHLRPTDEEDAVLLLPKPRPKNAPATPASSTP